MRERRAPRPGQCRALRLSIEALEDRCVPSATGPGSALGVAPPAAVVRSDAAPAHIVDSATTIARYSDSEHVATGPVTSADEWMTNGLAGGRPVTEAQPEHSSSAVGYPGSIVVSPVSYALHERSPASNFEPPPTQP